MRNIVVDWFKVAGIKNVHDYAVYSDYPDKEKDYKAFCEDKSDSIKLLFSINMLNEGVHIKDISGVIMLRTTLSNIIYLQQLGRLVEAENMGKYLLVFDFVNNFSSANDGIGLLKEIKNAIAKEKENDPNFDDSGFEDIDTFFVLEQIMEVEEMFKEIEERLEGSWDMYVRALRQFRERMGDCDVPSEHVEVVDGVGLKLGQWIGCVRKSKKGKGTYLLTVERINQLDEMGFIWDVLKYKFEKYIKALKQYKERMGDCDVPGDYVEIVDGEEVKLGRWCNNKRSVKKGQSDYLLTAERIKQLDEIGFIWNVSKYRFAKNIKAVAEYFKEYGKYPSQKSEDIEIKRLGEFVIDEKKKIRNKNSIYPKWKKEILEKYLPDFSCKTRSDRLFNEFIYYVKLYKKRYKHVDIKHNDKIDGYNIGSKRNTLIRCKSLSKNQKKELEDLGIYLGNKNDKRFKDNMDFAKQAIEDGMIVSNSNRRYRDTDLYDWVVGTVKRRYVNKKLSLEEIQIIERLMGKSLDELYCGRKEPVKVRVIDVIENKEIGIFESKRQVSKVMQEKFGVNASSRVIDFRLSGKFIKPYMGRFMFYRVDENGEVTE